MTAVHKSINVTHHINKLKRKSHLFVSTDTEKAFDQNSMPIHDKNSQKSKIAVNFLNLIKNIYKKLTANIIFNCKGLNAFLLRSGPR